jgi:hypothetical protein
MMPAAKYKAQREGKLLKRYRDISGIYVSLTLTWTKD